MKNGFTYIELIIVLILIAIIAVIAVPRIMNIGEFRLDAAAHKIAADLKYAREYAISHNCRTKVNYMPGNEKYEIYEESSGTWGYIKDPATHSDFIVVLDSGEYAGVLIDDVSFDEDSSVFFYPTGTPYASSEEPLQNIGIITITYGKEGEGVEIKVEPIAGRIYVD